MKNRKVVLIVEVHQLARKVAVEIFEGSGFEIIDACDADDAIRILTARPDIQIVFSDMHIPGSKAGAKLAWYVRSRIPRLQIIAVAKCSSFGKLPQRGSAQRRKPHHPFRKSVIVGNRT